MEKTNEKILPSDVFITTIDAGELKWRADEGGVIKNRPSGNEFMDKLVELLSVYHMSKVVFYEKAMNLSTRSLNEMTVRYSGMRFMEWRNQYVLLCAKELLIETNYSLDKIGKRLGFSCINSFSKWFARSENENTKDWRYYAKMRHKKREEEQFLEWKTEKHKKGEL